MKMNSNKRTKYAYLVLAFHIHDSEIGVWQALSERIKADLSKEFYELVARETVGLQESAGKRMPRATYKSHARRLFLVPLPEHETVIRFIRANIRRPAFMAHLKTLILRCGKAAAPPVARAPAKLENLVHSPPEPQVSNGNHLRGPNELFHDPNMLIQTMHRELMKPESERIFDWDTIRPEAYPDAVKASRLFVRLEEYWSNKHKR